MDRRPMDLDAYTERARSGPCFVCAFLAGNGVLAVPPEESAALAARLHEAVRAGRRGSP
ncbi:hypothetical protein ACIPW5_04825 [Streptomyces sp. NPDC090077]|uniref:hypothetical protein n=1 Tax=Streptomyces sp. NPDC090077 TaxID=3365938 RepID=UPI00381A14AC